MANGNSGANPIHTERHLVVTVHGIRTFGGWQEKLEGLLAKSNGSKNITVLNYKYGYFSIIAFIIPFFRWMVVRRFRKDLNAWCKAEDWDRIDLVGHSFGTHVLAWALHGIPVKERLKIHTIILSGSVLRGSFPWRDLVGSSVERVINDCGSKDNVLVINQLLVLFTGMAGRVGFNGATHRTFRNRYFSFGHSGYFYDHAGHLGAGWMADHWLPLLTSDHPIKLYDEREPPSVLDGVVHTLANNAEPVKLTIYMAPLVLLGGWILGLYVDERSARQEAQNQTAFTLSMVADIRSAMGFHAEAYEIVARALQLANDDSARRRAQAAYDSIINAYATDYYDLTIDELVQKHNGSLQPIEQELASRLGESVVDTILLGTETYDRVGVRQIEFGQREVAAEIGLDLDQLDPDEEALLPEFETLEMTLGECDYRDEDIFQCAGAFSLARHKVIVSVGPFLNEHYLGIDEKDLNGEIVWDDTVTCEAGEEICTITYYTHTLLNAVSGDKR